MSRHIDFLIVGTPRSGTTLVQKLVCELEGVRVPPETHFFSKFLPALQKRRRFPLDGPNLAAEIHEFSAMPSSRALLLDPGEIAGDLNNYCETPMELFSAIVRHLAGPARLYGEKTTEHLLWLRTLAGQSSRLKAIAVVRDPRDVAASSLSVAAWKQKSSVKLAAWWRSDQRELMRATEELSSGRLLVVRYEDIVTDPQAARRTLAEFLEKDSTIARAPGKTVWSGDLYQPWEYWKSRVNDPITSTRIGAFQERLSTVQAESIMRICRKELLHFGYPVDVSHRPGILTSLEVGAWIWARKWLLPRSPRSIWARKWLPPRSPRSIWSPKKWKNPT